MTQKLPAISIIIPSFNKGKFIEDTLTSIVDQKYPGLEVIVQDGGSTDETLQILQKFSKKYEYIKYYSKKDKGQTDALNQGFAKASGEILTYINADDLYVKGAFFKVGNFFSKNPESNWVAGLGKVVNSEGKEVAKLVTFYKTLLQLLRWRPLLLCVNYLYQPSVFFRKSFVKQRMPFTGIGKIVLEYEMWLKMAEKRMHGNINTTLSLFRLTGDSFSSNNFADILEWEYKIVKKHTNNFVVLFIHRLNNLGRILLVKLMT